MNNCKCQCECEHKLYGKISNAGEILYGTINAYDVLYGIIQVGNDNSKRDYYQGNYSITPQIQEQQFNTKNKTMKDDVVVKAIPYYEVSNDMGGDTIIIGGL